MIGLQIQGHLVEQSAIVQREVTTQNKEQPYKAAQEEGESQLPETGMEMEQILLDCMIQLPVFSI